MNRRAEVVTSNYEFVTGRAPRGFGHWAFSPAKHSRLGADDILWVNGAYWREAKKAAAVWGGSKGYDVVYVQS